MAERAAATNPHLFSPNALDEFALFDAVIDVRSPSEFALDHVPGAVNFPVLDDGERARIGTLHKQVSPFAARREGAAIVAQRIAGMLANPFFERERHWRPLVMCWRGGKRSGSLTHVLRQIGWPAAQLDGGYRAYRALVNQSLATVPASLRYVVVAGRTGSGKSRLLNRLAAHGAQVLDLEELANHRGSVLGAMPQTPQPSQKWFESKLVDALTKLTPIRPIFVESESKKIGDLRVPERLIQAMRASPCAVIDASLPTRTELLLEEYQHFLGDQLLLAQQLDCLKALHGNETIARWKALGQASQWQALVHALLTGHYDPAYDRSMQRNFSQLGMAKVFNLSSAQGDSFDQLASRLINTYETASSSQFAALVE